MAEGQRMAAAEVVENGPLPRPVTRRGPLTS
jgi:hypothetical protein